MATRVELGHDVKTTQKNLSKFQRLRNLVKFSWQVRNGFGTILEGFLKDFLIWSLLQFLISEEGF